MNPTTLFLLFLIVFTACVVLTMGIIRLLSPGVLKYFQTVFHDEETANFFLRMFRLVLLMSGLSAALSSRYGMDENSNWLTVSWEVTRQFKSTLGNLFDALMAFTVVFLILHLLNKLLTR